MSREKLMVLGNGTCNLNETEHKITYRGKKERRLGIEDSYLGQNQIEKHNRGKTSHKLVGIVRIKARNKRLQA